MLCSHDLIPQASVPEKPISANPRLNQPNRGINSRKFYSVPGSTITANQVMKYALNLIHLARSINSLIAE